MRSIKVKVVFRRIHLVKEDYLTRQQNQSDKGFFLSFEALLRMSGYCFQLDHKVLGSNQAGLNSTHDYTALNCTELFIITLPLSRYNLSDVERDVKHQIIII